MVSQTHATGSKRALNHLAQGPRTVADFLTMRAEEAPSQLALVLQRRRGRSRRTTFEPVSYRSLEDFSWHLGLQLKAQGLGQGTRVAMMVPPSAELFALTFALFRVGCVPIFMDPAMGVRSLTSCLKVVRPDAFVGTLKAHAVAKLMGWPTGRVRILVGPGGVRYESTDFVERRRPERSWGDSSKSDLSAILFTSGSTGLPKGVLYTQRHFLGQIAALKEALQINPGDIDLCTFPLFGLFGPALGLTSVIPIMDFTRPGRINPDPLLAAIRDFHVTNMFSSPALMQRLVGAGRSRSLASLQRLIMAGAAVSPMLLQACTKLVAPETRIVTPYGATEALPIAVIDSLEILGETHRETSLGRGVCVGRPVAGVSVGIMAIHDHPQPEWSQKDALPAMVMGEIVVHGPQVSDAYDGDEIFNRMAKMRDATTGSTWHRMGDIGYFDTRGRLWFCGRKSQRVITPEGVLFPDAIEGVFYGHGEIRRTALVGRRSHQMQPMMDPVLFVEPRRTISRQRRHILREDLAAMARHLPIPVTLRDIRFIRRLPVDARHNSKIRRELLAEQLVKEGPQTCK